MAFLTRSQFYSIANRNAGPVGLGGPVKNKRRFSKTTSTTTIFLSHSHKDKDIIEQAKVFFENLGISIYIDWADETMPERTSGLTATRIKNKIITENDKFVLLATNNAIASKWCSWEVGIADPFKLPKKKIALLPISENSGSWEGNEYLQVYPRIELNNIKRGGQGYFVWYPDGTWDTLNEWLNR